MKEPPKKLSKRPPGRPATPDLVERRMIGTRVMPEVYDQLAAAARDHRMTLSEEVARRLEKSFEPNFASQSLEAFGSHVMTAFRMGGQLVAQDRPFNEWVKDPVAYERAVALAIEALMSWRPNPFRFRDAAGNPIKVLGVSTTVSANPADAGKLRFHHPRRETRAGTEPWPSAKSSSAFLPSGLVVYRAPYVDGSGKRRSQNFPDRERSQGVLRNTSSELVRGVHYAGVGLTDRGDAAELWLAALRAQGAGGEDAEPIPPARRAAHRAVHRQLEALAIDRGRRHPRLRRQAPRGGPLAGDDQEGNEVARRRSLRRPPSRTRRRDPDPGPRSRSAGTRRPARGGSEPRRNCAPSLPAPRAAGGPLSWSRSSAACAPRNCADCSGPISISTAACFTSSSAPTKPTKSASSNRRPAYRAIRMPPIVINALTGMETGLSEGRTRAGVPEQARQGRELYQHRAVRLRADPDRGRHHPVARMAGWSPNTVCMR